MGYNISTQQLHYARIEGVTYMTNQNSDSDNRIKMITGDPERAIRSLSFPMMLIVILIIGYQIVDSVWVAGLGGRMHSLL
jgi:Na+-driven multidrug efflux pump